MARIGTKRVSDILDYERDIKGKRLIRLSAGVGSGKNYWAVKVAKDNPELRMLLITSRKNTVEVQAKKMGAVKFFDLDYLIDNEEWGYNPNAKRKYVCTNAGIWKFLRTQYKYDDPRTHLWNMFDLIILDEAHSLTEDATFADSSFHVEKFLKAAYRNNPNCDIILMSGTQEPIDWLFSGEKNQGLVTNIDCFEKDCIHLDPDTVRLYPKEAVGEQLYRLWSKGERVIYFANYTDSMKKLIEALIADGVPMKDIAIAFSDDVSKPERQEKFHEDLLARMKEVNDYLVTEERLHPDVKLFFTTSKNKEGITILDDDVKYMFSESNRKYELVQMAGRVRGNPDTGTGLKELIVIHGTKQHGSNYSSFNQCMSEECVQGVNKALRRYYIHCQRKNENFDADKVIKTICTNFPYLRYDYISRNFHVFYGKIYGDKQAKKWNKELKEIVECVDWPCFHDNVLTGYEVFEEEWFPYSKCIIYKLDAEKAKENVASEAKRLLNSAKEEFLTYLKDNNLYEVPISAKQKDDLREPIRKLVAKYGEKNIGIKETFSDVTKAVKKLDIKMLRHGKKGNNDPRTYWILTKIDSEGEEKGEVL